MQMDATLHMDYFKKFALAADVSFGVAVLLSMFVYLCACLSFSMGV